MGWVSWLLLVMAVLPHSDSLREKKEKGHQRGVTLVVLCNCGVV